MTQGLIANLMGVRRDGVTEDALKLQHAGLIRYACGHITPLDRVGLEKRTRQCHAVVKKGSTTDSYRPVLLDRPSLLTHQVGTPR